MSWSAREIEAVGEPVHVLATGIAAHGAVVLAVRHPELVVSLLLGDPADESPSTERDLLGRVTTPTLVIASQPDGGRASSAEPDGGRASSAEPDGGRESVSSAAQALAGGIDNGVFVVIDGAAVPAHRERGASFDEWVTSFTIIAEGLGALGAHRQEEVHV
ncbi:hydrolase [Rhodococcus triatomae]|nr:hydrolase [Rhodococcus triatomae]QNG25595.1 hydrolase [Rhodococcus triatomae]